MNDRDLILAAAELARSSPEAWSRFLTRFGDYAEDKIVECVQAPLDMLPVAQGRAQALVKLGQLLEDCIKTADAITSRPSPNARRP